MRETSDVAPASRSASLDYVIGVREQPLRHRKAQRPRGFQIDNELELARLLHRQVAGLPAPQDTIDVGCGTHEVLKQDRCRMKPVRR